MDSSHFYRGYHSSALLLPDGRVLVASGNATTDYPGHVGKPFYKHQLMGDLYSPPYLFNADGSKAERNTILSSPRRVSYGQRFVIRMAAPGAMVDRFVLVRPGAVTHGFDQSQRYVELISGSVSTNEPQHTHDYWVDVPSDSAVAPPGEYLLFGNRRLTPVVRRRVQRAASSCSSRA